MIKPLFLFVGKSGSGKTTIADYLTAHKGYKQVQSYTTRLPRFEEEKGHIFIGEEEFSRLDELVAYTEYNNNKYGVTAEMVDKADIYIIDVPGVKTLLEKYRSKRHIVVFYFDTNIPTRIDRMLDRGDCDAAIVSRIYNDEQYDWYEELYECLFPNMIEKRNPYISLVLVDADKDLDDVIEQITLILDDLDLDLYDEEF